MRGTRKVGTSLSASQVTRHLSHLCFHWVLARFTHSTAPMLQYVRMALSPASSLYYRETEMPDPDICDNLPDLVAGYHSSSEAESCPLQQSFTSQPKASRCCDRLVAGQSAAIRRYTVRKESAECALHLQRNSISREIASPEK